MEERTDLILKEASSANPPTLLQELVRSLDDLLPAATDAGGKWLKGKGEAEVSKAMEIRARALKLIGDLQHDQERLIAERNAAMATVHVEHKKAELAHAERMYELRTARLKTAAEIIVRLRYLGVQVEMKVDDKLGRAITRSAKELLKSFLR